MAIRRPTPFTSDQHPDYVMATVKRGSATHKRSLTAEPAEKQDNPTPFNISEWWDAKPEGDPRWRYGTPPRGNAKFAWIQHREVNSLKFSISDAFIFRSN